MSPQTQTCQRSALMDMLRARLPAEPFDWLCKAVSNAASMDDRRLEQAIALAARKCGRGMLAPTRAEQDAACRLHMADWTVADAARTAILCGRAEGGDFGASFRFLCRTADLSSLIGFYRAVPALPYDADLDWQLGEGLRTSVAAVFQAIAHHNPVPAERFDEHRWNHMVLKALFIETSLPPIVGLDRRRNAALAATLVDHVQERRAAGRPVDLHVWRCIAPFAKGAVLQQIAPLADSAQPKQRLAAALFLRESPDPDAVEWLQSLNLSPGPENWSALD